MPKYRNISIQLHSDTTNVILELAPPSTARHSPTKCLTPLLQDDDKGQISVYVPIIPKALFWLSYGVEPPPVDGSFFVFKLLVNRQEVVTWSCDMENKFKGKTMFGLFDTNSETDGSGRAMQKRVFQFGSSDSRIVGNLTGEREEDRFLEVRVFRAKGKKRTGPLPRNYAPLTEPGLELVNGGLLKPQAPQRYYRFGLIDPVDKPHATFRFYYRTWDEIDQLGLHMGQVDADDSVLFSATTEGDGTTTFKANQLSSKKILSNTASPITDPLSVRPTASPSSISGSYFNSFATPRSVGGTHYYPPNTSSTDGQTQLPYHTGTYKHLYHPQPAIPPPYNSGHQANDFSDGARSTYLHSTNVMPTSIPAASAVPSVQTPINFSSPLNRPSIPPHLLLQPLLTRSPLAPTRSNIVQREMEASTEIPTDVSTLPTAPPLGIQAETSEASRGRSPRKLIRRRCEEKESSGGRLKLFIRRRSREGVQSTEGN